MPDTLLRIIEKLMDFAKGPVCAASGILLALYTYRINAFYLYTLLSSSIIYPASIFIIFIVSGMFFLRDVLSMPSRRFSKLNMEWKSRRVACDKVRYSLTYDQKKVLQMLIDSPNHSYYFVYSGHIEELMNYHIIVSREIELKTDRYATGLDGHYLYTIEPWALKYLKKHPALLQISKT